MKLLASHLTVGVVFVGAKANKHNGQVGEMPGEAYDDSFKMVPDTVCPFVVDVAHGYG